MSTPTVAVVTGAARGIGFELARQLSVRGHRVLLTDLDEAAAREAAAAIGDGAWSMGQDVSDQGSHRAVATEAQRHGVLATWVNNAGILLAGDAWRHSEDQVTDILEVNVGGVMGGSRAAIDAMGERGGAILNLASISALGPVPGLALYAATKAAVLSFSTSLQGDLDHAGRRIRVRALCPDVVGTDMVTTREKDPGAALLFSGPQPLDVEQVATAGLELLESRQLFRVVPRWRGALVRGIDAAPSVGLRSLSLMRRIGDRRQRRL